MKREKILFWIISFNQCLLIGVVFMSICSYIYYNHSPNLWAYIYIYKKLFEDENKMKIGGY